MEAVNTSLKLISCCTLSQFLPTQANLQVPGMSRQSIISTNQVKEGKKTLSFSPS